MANNYDGDPLATQAPSNPPNPDSGPTVVIPEDGDTRNAASLEQQMMATADWIAWLRDPITLDAVVGSWEQRTWGVKNARQQRRWYLDHLGHPSGKIVKWVENWRGLEQQTSTGSTTFADTVRPWSVDVVETSGTGAVAVTLPGFALGGSGGAGGPTTKRSRVLLLQVAGAAADRASAYDNPEAIFTADNSMALDIPIWPGAAGVNTHDLVMGFTTQAAMPWVSGFEGAAFYQDPSVNSNWWVATGAGSAPTLTDTGVAVAGAAWQNLRVEWWGANVADDSVAAVRFYVDGVIKATHTAALPTNFLAGKILRASKQSGVDVLASYIGPVQYSYDY